MVVGHCSLVTAHYSFLIGHCSLLNGHWSLETGHWLLVVGHWLLLIAHWSLSVGQYLLRTDHTSLVIGNWALVTAHCFRHGNVLSIKPEYLTKHIFCGFISLPLIMPPLRQVFSSPGKKKYHGLVPQPPKYFPQFRDEKSRGELNEAFALQLSKLKKLKADVAEIPGLFSEMLSTPEGKLVAKEASVLQDKGMRILESEEFKAATEQAFVVLAGINRVLLTPQAAAFGNHLQQVGLYGASRQQIDGGSDNKLARLWLEILSIFHTSGRS